MAISQTRTVICQLSSTLQSRHEARTTDGQLLTRFLEGRDAGAFAAIVKRHGPMVWGVCRRLLSHHDAEDAFQATFLVLARKAQCISPRELVANWLHGVAHQTALHARRTAARRYTRERLANIMPDPEADKQALWDDVQPILDEELRRLPEKYRVVLILCDLESRTRKEVARQLNCPEGTVSGRLARARRLLASRLSHRGVVLSLAGLAALLTQHMATAAPLAVISSTITLVAGQSVPTKVALLSDGVMKMMLFTNLKSFAIVILIIAGVFMAGGSFSNVDASPPVTSTAFPIIQDQRQAQPDPKQLLRQAEKACKNIRIIEYIEEQGNIGEPPTVKATIRQAKSSDPSAGPFPGKYRLEFQIKDDDDKPRTIIMAYDGKALRGSDGREKVIRVIPSATDYIAGSLTMEFGSPIVGCSYFTNDQAFENVLKNLVSCDYKGTREILGTPCHVIEAVWTREVPGFDTMTIDHTLFIGKTDLLPRGFDSRGKSKHYRILRVNDPAISTDFSIAIPEGYTEERFTGHEPRTKDLLAVGAMAPEWTLPAPDGKQHSLKDYRGKIVVLDFWGTWCLPCKKGMPGIQALHDKFKDRGVAVLGVAVNDKEGDATGYMRRMKFTYGLLLKGETITNEYKAATLPTVYVIGPDGKILHAEYGYREKAKDELSAVIERCLLAPAAVAPREPKLRDELLQREQKDQKARKRFEELERRPKNKDQEETKRLLQEAVANCLAIDKENIARMKEIVKQYGWPGKTLVGKDGASAAWLLVQHADVDIPFQKHCVELLANAVKMREAAPANLAYLTDRVCVHEKQKQVYGTQFHFVNGKLKPHPIEDEQNVDKRRKEAGLPPLAAYLVLGETLFNPSPGSK